MNTAEVTLDEVLAFRDRRRSIQDELREKHGLPLISFTMNIAGPVKRSAAADFVFGDTLERIVSALGAPAERRIISVNAGNEAMLAYACPAAELKRVCTALEEEGTAGRLLDLDVLDEHGEKLSRTEERRCLICGGPVTPCARSRAHSLEEIREKTASILREHAAVRTGELAVQALLDEVHLTPKPGLVDRNNSGAHRDMDLALMEKSAYALQDYFTRAVRLGMDRGAHCAPALQDAGLKAETAMKETTGGVNTHRGAIYSMGLLCAGAGMALAGTDGDVTALASGIAAGLRTVSRDSHGERVMKAFRTGGARAEAAAAFPHVRIAREALRERDDALCALLSVMCVMEDTNVLWRGGAEGLRFVQERSAELLALAEDERRGGIAAFDRECIEKNLSPGGAADMLACAIFLRSFERRADSSAWDTEEKIV